MNIEIKVRRIWSREWIVAASKTDLELGIAGWFGVMFCLGAFLGILLV